MKKIARRAILFSVLGIFALLILFEIILQIYNYTYTHITSETAVYTTITESIDAHGYVVRNEQLVYFDDSGVCAYNCEDGGRVSSGSVVAYVYPSQEQAEVHQKIKRINSEINQLKELQSDSNAVNASNQELLMSEIDDKNIKLVKAVQDCDYIEVNELREQILYLMTKYNIVTGEGEGVDDRISKLTAQLSQLTDSISVTPQTVGAPCTGYFISSIDGYESVFSAETIADMTPEQFNTAAASVTTPQESYGVVGKIATGFNWYYACVLTDEEAKIIKERSEKGEKIKIVLGSCSKEKLSVTLYAVNEGADGTSLVIFECRNMSETLANIREEDATIVIGEYSGIGVSKKAIRSTDFIIGTNGDFEMVKKQEKDENGQNVQKSSDEDEYEKVVYTYMFSTDKDGNKIIIRNGTDGSTKEMTNYDDINKVKERVNEEGNTYFAEENVSSVYAIIANKVVLRRINIIYDNGENDGTVICKDMTGAAKSSLKYLKQYDEIAVKGRNLYEGKLVG